MTHVRRDTVNWPGNSGQSSSELNHPILKEEPVDSTPNSRSQHQEGEIPSPPSALNSANGSAHAPESPPLSSESITYSRARDALLQLAIPDQNFTAVQHIGEGGQGDSYLLVNQQGEKFKAKILKEVPKKALYCPKEELAENLPEVKYFSKLNIPGVAKVIGAYSVEDPNLGRVVVVVSEYVEGETLQTKIRKLEPEQGLGVSETFNLLVKLSTSLAELHGATRNELRQRIVHGDLKPANIVLSDSSDPTLIDFGSTKAVTPGHTEQFTMVTSGLHSVSRPYSPFEQYVGQRLPASDIYALGVTVIECLLGRIPQELNEAFENLQPFVVKPSATIPKPLAVILTKMVALKPKERYQDGQELLTALREAEESIVNPTKPGLLVRGGQALWRGLSQALRALRSTSGATVPLEARPQGVAEQLITEAGGIFVGEAQLKKLRVIRKNATIPPIPEKFSKEFLNATHPIRGGKIAEHIILGFDPQTKQWYCFEKSIVPGSLGKNWRGLSGPKQDKLLLGKNSQPYTVEGVQYSSPTDYRPIKRVLDNVIKLQRKNGANVRDLPFHGIFGRTADTLHARPGGRVLLGYSSQRGSDVAYDDLAAAAYPNVGLLAGWN